jgi:signal transduction histidine kinase
MRNLIFVLLLISSTSFAQKYQQIDTIADVQLAIKKFHAAIAKEPNDPELYLLLAKKKRLAKENDSTIFYCNKAIALLAVKPNDSLWVIGLHIKGTAQYYLDDKLKAEANWGKGLPIAIKNNFTSEIVSLSSNVAAIILEEIDSKRRSTKNYKTADSLFQIAYKNLKKSNTLSTDQGFLTQRLMATSLQYQHKNDSANFYYEQIIALSKGISNTGYISAILLYATSLSEIGQHQKAKSVIITAAQIVTDSTVDPKNKAAVLELYGRIMNASGDYAAAYKLSDSSYKLIHNEYREANTKAYAESESKFKNQILEYQIQIEQQKKNRLYFLLAGIFLIAALSFLWLRNRSRKKIEIEKAKQKQISIDAFIEGEEKEKARIGRELHDGIAQEIVGIKLAMVQQNANPTIVAELNRISLDIRNIAHELMPQTLKEYGLQLAIEDICQKILAPSGIQFELDANLPEARLPHKIEITLYRIFQELAHNIIKHSQATEVLVQLRKMNNHILLVVEDNGKGMAASSKNGIGISNLKSRVQLLDGNIQYESSDNEGTTAIVRVPF